VAVERGRLEALGLIGYEFRELGVMKRYTAGEFSADSCSKCNLASEMRAASAGGSTVSVVDRKKLDHGGTDLAADVDKASNVAVLVNPAAVIAPQREKRAVHAHALKKFAIRVSVPAVHQQWRWIS
jgi:hypothetical protein